MVVAGWASWWFTVVGVEESAHAANSDSGAMSSGVLLTATPVEAPREGGAVGPASGATAPETPSWAEVALAPSTPAVVLAEVTTVLAEDLPLLT